MHHITAVLRAFLCWFMLIYINDVVFCCRWPQCPSAPGSWSWRRKWLIFSFRWELWEPRPPDPLHLHYRTRRSLQYYSLMWITHSRDYFSLKNFRNKCACNKKNLGRRNCVLGEVSRLLQCISEFVRHHVLFEKDPSASGLISNWPAESYLEVKRVIASAAFISLLLLVLKSISCFSRSKSWTASWRTNIKKCFCSSRNLHHLSRRTLLSNNNYRIWYVLFTNLKTPAFISHHDRKVL